MLFICELRLEIFALMRAIVAGVAIAPVAYRLNRYAELTRQRWDILVGCLSVGFCLVCRLRLPVPPNVQGRLIQFPYHQKTIILITHQRSAVSNCARAVLL